MPGACTGLRVVEITRGMAGSLAGMILADHGADVVRLESPKGDPSVTAAAARTWGRGKSRVALDMDDASQREHALELVRSADVLLLAIRPTVAEGWGLTYERLAETNPGLIFATISGFGWDGPARDQPVNEGLMYAWSGATMMGGTGAHREPPIYFAPHTAAYGAGLLAVQGILAALRERDGSGQGQHVDIGLYQAMLVYRASGLWNPELHPEEFPVTAAAGDARGVRPLFNLSQCADGRWLSMGAWTPALSYKALEVMGLTHLLADERFVGIPNFFPDEEARRELLEILWARFRQEPLQHWLDTMDAQGIPCEPVQTVAEFRPTGQLWANDLAVRVDDPVLGSMLQQGVLGELSATPGSVRAAEATARPAAAADEIAERWQKAASVRGSGAMRPGGRGPLAGVRVLDLTVFLSGPTGGHLLADLGADVIKAEPPEGDDFRMSVPFVFRFLHRDKQGVVLNLKTAGSQEDLEALVRQSDVVLYNYRLGVEERLGLSYERLSGLNPRVIVCRITAFGARGERAHRGGYDASISALAGMLDLQGGSGNPPVSLSVSDVSTGIAAATAISLAIRAQETMGIGQHIDVTMIGSMAHVGGDAFVHYEGMPEVALMDSGQNGIGPLQRLYRTGDGWLMLSARSDREDSVRAALSLDSAASLDVRTLEGVFAGGTTSEWLQALGRAGVPCCNGAGDPRAFLHETPELRANGTAITVPNPRYGALGQPGPAIRFSRTPVRVERQEPGLGEHNEMILRSASKHGAP